MESPAAQQQSPGDMADMAILRRETRAHLLEMVQTSRCFDRFCSDMQAAVNELSQYDVQLYLDVTHTCAQLKNCMNIATRQSAMFINSEQGHADPIRNHIRRVMERLEELRRHRNRIADIYLTGMVYENPEVWQLQTTLEMHMSLLQYDVLRIVHVTKGEPRLSDDLEAAGHIPEASQPAPQED